MSLPCHVDVVTELPTVGQIPLPFSADENDAEIWSPDGRRKVTVQMDATLQLVTTVSDEVLTQPAVDDEPIGQPGAEKKGASCAARAPTVIVSTRNRSARRTSSTPSV